MTESKDGGSVNWMQGVPVKFPYPSMYTSQRQIILGVINTLTKCQNAILESPTGSGKSLAILCSVLAWHTEKFPDKEKKRPHIKIGDLPDRPSSDADYKITSEGPEGVVDDLNKFKFESNGNTNFNHDPSTNGPRVNPLEFRKAPTPPPKIIFTSRTHSQLQQLIAEYRRTAYADSFRMAVLGSRKSLCVNPKIKDLSDRNDKCKKALDLRDCRYYRNRMYIEKFKDSDEFKPGKVFDIEDMVNVGEKRGLCPYFGSHGLMENANVLFCPYNYILDPVIRKQMSLDIKNSIVIIDEAHNVEDVCRSALTKSYSLEDLEITVASLDDLLKGKGRYQLAEEVFEAVSEIKCFVDLVKTWMVEREGNLDGADYRNHRNVYPHPQSGKNKIRDLFKSKFDYDARRAKQLGHWFGCILSHFEDLRKDQNENQMPPTPVKPNATPSKRSKNMTQLNPKASVVIEYLVLVLFPKILQFENDFVLAFLPEPQWDSTLNRQITVPMLHIWCLSPAVAFKEISDDAHSVILTSGTLSPLEATSTELRCDFPQRLEADHVIEKGQVLVTAIDRGPNGNQLKLVYDQLKRESVLDDVGASLLELMQNVPEGMVVFFPSYNTMERMVERWQMNGLYEQMVSTKTIYQEPKGSDEEATQQFLNAIETFGRDCGNIKYIKKYQRSKEYKREMAKLKRKEQEAKEREKKKGSLHKFLVKKSKTKKEKSPALNGENDDYSFSSNFNGNRSQSHSLSAEGQEGVQNGDLASKYRAEKGAVFFGVCRGKISEGIDFSDGMSRAVVLIGIPYPNQKSPEISFKKAYNDREVQKAKMKWHEQQKQHQSQSKGSSLPLQEPHFLDGKKWYLQQAYRALNQALGRCIRHKHDYGVIVFLESRFHGQSGLAKSNVNQLSKWVRPYMRSSLTARAAVRDLIKPYFEHLIANPPDAAEGGRWKPPFQMPNTAWLSMANGRGYNRYGRSHSNRLSKISRPQQPLSFQSANNHHSYRSSNHNQNQQRKQPLTASMTQIAPTTTTSTFMAPTAGGPLNGNSVSPNLKRNQMKKESMTQIPSSTISGGPNGGNINDSNSSNRFFSQSDYPQNGVNAVKHEYASSSNVSPLNGNSRRNERYSNIKSDEMKTSSISPPEHSSTSTISTTSNDSGSTRNGGSNARKRKYIEFQNENVTPSDAQWTQKRMKSEVISNEKSNEAVIRDIIEIDDIEDDDVIDVTPIPNCIQCLCGAVVCKGEVMSIDLQRGAKMETFIATKQPFPCDTANNCIWSSQLGLTFMWHKCSSCRQSIGFHVVGASSKDRLQYIENILFLPKVVKLLRVSK